MKKYVVEVSYLQGKEEGFSFRFETTYFNLTDTVKELNNPYGEYIQIGNIILRKNDVMQIIMFEKVENNIMVP